MNEIEKLTRIIMIYNEGSIDEKDKALAQTILDAGYLPVEEVAKKERQRWIDACAYHGIKIEQPQQLKRIISQIKGE